MTAVDAVTSPVGVCLTANIAETACEPRTTAPPPVRDEQPPGHSMGNRGSHVAADGIGDRDTSCFHALGPLISGR